MAKRKPRQPVAVDHGPNERWQHAVKVIEGVRDGAAMLPRARNQCECVLDHYSCHALINDRQYAAGLKFRALYMDAHPPQAVTAGYGQRLDPSPESEEETPAERQCRQAIATLGLVNASTVIAVCVRDEFVGSVLRRTRLRDGLTDLANLWGIP